MRVFLRALVLLMAYDFSDTAWQKDFNIDRNERYSRTRFLVAKHNYYNSLPGATPPRITEWDASPSTTTPSSSSSSFSTGPPPSSVVKSRKLLRRERSKLRKSLKSLKVREDKKARDGILRRLNEINAEIRKHATKKQKQRQRKRKHKAQHRKSNILEVTTARSKTSLHLMKNNGTLNKIIKRLNQNPELDFSNELKIPATIQKKFKTEDAPDYKTPKVTSTSSSTRPFKSSAVADKNKTTLLTNSIKPSAATDKNKTTTLTNSISKINYADLMKIHSTTLPPVKNVTLDAILEEFNVISNQIGVLFPGLPKYPKHNLTKQGEAYGGRKKMMKTRCSYRKGGCEHVCHPRGPKKCSCLRGFKLAVNKRQCLDINECLSNNGGCTAACLNTPGSYYCSCSTGLRLSDDGKSCEDINECLLRNGHGPCQDTCKNTYGSYECTCAGLNGTRLGRDEHSCEDVDECAEGRSGCSHGCVNTLGRAYCTCPDGMELGSDWKTCRDTDECDDNEISKCKFGCINTIGSYFCTDDFEVQGDQTVSPIPDHVACPPLFPPQRGFLACSREKGLRVKMRSKSGRTRVTNRPGTFCQLVCPAGHKMVGLFQVICGLDGRWMGDKSGTCLAR